MSSANVPPGWSSFTWAVGEESSDPIVLRRDEPYRVDELAGSGHLERQDEDLGDIAALGVEVIRYGIPWRLVETGPGLYDWTLWDRSLEACRRHGLEPVVDLCHFGLPDHLPGFCDPSWIEPFLRYVDAFLDRYPQPRWFTPVNEPMTTALFSGRLGAWNDRRASNEDFALALALCAVANLEAHARILADRHGWSIGAEALSIPTVARSDESALMDLALTRATWDLHLGHRIDPVAEPVFETVPGDLMARIADLATTEHVVAGHDLYPVSVHGDDLTISDRLDAYERWAADWHSRYRLPFWIAETSNMGLPVGEQVEWLDALVARLHAMRDRGLPVRGLCWYSRGDQFDWQTGLIEPTGAVTEVGLFTQGRVARRSARCLRDHATEGRT
jgi:beta-glucosidase